MATPEAAKCGLLHLLLEFPNSQCPECIPTRTLRLPKERAIQRGTELGKVHHLKGSHVGTRRENPTVAHDDRRRVLPWCFPGLSGLGWVGVKIVAGRRLVGVFCGFP